MLSQLQKSQFAQDGFVVVPNVLTAEQVEQLRSFLTRQFDSPPQFPGDTAKTNASHPAVRFDICTRFPELRWLMIHPPLIATLRSILGDDFVLLPEMSAHDSGFGSWHADTGSQERAGHLFHLDPDFLMLEAAFYLQDNGPYGGGLDVIPGSHLERDKSLPEHRDLLTRTKLTLDVWGVRKAGYSIPSRAGDLVLFDFRIQHRATAPGDRRKAPGVPRKLAIFFACSRNNAHARRYVDFIRGRADYVYLQGHEYPEAMLALAREHHLTLL
jgi:hypothetical protein